MISRFYIGIALLAAVPAIAVAADISATKAYMDAMNTMNAQMQAMQPTGDADKDFVMMMKPHHQAAVDMAEAYLKSGSDPLLTKMAHDIIASQEQEITQMSDWQSQHAK